MGIRLKYQILEWKCANNCGTTLNEMDYTTNKKYCPECLSLKRKARMKKHNAKRYRKKFPVKPQSKIVDIIYILKTNKLASIGELAAFSRAKETTVRTYIWRLRRKHWIKFVDGFYYYFGEKPKQ